MTEKRSLKLKFCYGCWLQSTAMALQGKNRQYHFSMIQPRHFISTAQHIGFSSERAAALMKAMAAQSEDVINQVAAQLPTAFPKHISEAIFTGVLHQADKIRKA